MSNAEGLYRMDASAASRAAEIALGALKVRRAELMEDFIDKKVCEMFKPGWFRAPRYYTPEEAKKLYEQGDGLFYSQRVQDEMIKEAREAGKTEGQNEQRRDQGSV